LDRSKDQKRVNQSSFELVKMEQKPPITWNTKLRYSLPLCAFFVISYVIPNRVQFIEPKTLPLLFVDNIIPLIPWTIFIYLTEYFIYFVVLIFIFDKLTFRRLLLSFMFMFLISMIAFFLYPTILLERPVVNGTGTAYFLFRFLHFVDNPVNCFPSQHVAIVSIPGMIFWRESRKTSILFWLWAILVSISTLTIKQHYVVDVFGGLLLAAFSVVLADKFNKEGFREKLPALFQKMLPN